MGFKRVFLIRTKTKFGENVIPYIPTIGMGIIAEILEQNGKGYDIVDMQLGYSFRHLKKKIQKFKPDLIGLDMITFRYKDNYKLIRKIKKKFPKIPIVVGGSHVMTVGTRLLGECKAVDFAIYGEGEETIPDLCNKSDLSKVKGLLYRKNDKVMFTGPRAPINDLDKIPFPRYRKWPLNKYIDNLLAPKFMKEMPKGVNYKMMPLFTSRGCPYSCIFCMHAFGFKWRGRSAKNIADEIEYWYKKGYRQFPVVEDNFTFDKKRVYELAKEIKKRGMANLHLSTPTGLRGDQVDKNLLKVMKEMGFRNLSFAVESASQKVLNLMKKGEKIETIERSIKDALALGYEIGLFFVLGTPGETIEDVKETIRFANKFPVDARFYNLIPYPHTELFNIVDKNGYFLERPEVYLNHSSRFYTTVYSTPEVSAKERDKLVAEMYKVKEKIRNRSYYEEYGLAGLIWSKITFITPPIMTFVWNLSPSLYRFFVKVYTIYRKSLVKKYKFKEVMRPRTTFTQKS